MPTTNNQMSGRGIQIDAPFIQKSQAVINKEKFLNDNNLVIVDILKRQIFRQHFSRSKRYLTCWHFQKISRRQAEDLSIHDEQDGDLDSTDPVKQPVSQLLSSKENLGS